MKAAQSSEEGMAGEDPGSGRGSRRASIVTMLQRLVSQLASMASSHQITQAGGATAQLLALIHTTPAPLITSKSIQFSLFK